MPDRAESLPIGGVVPHDPIFKKVPDSQAINELICGCHRKFLLLKDFSICKNRSCQTQLVRVILQTNEFGPQISGPQQGSAFGSINSGMAKNEDCNPRILASRALAQVCRPLFQGRKYRCQRIRQHGREARVAVAINYDGNPDQDGRPAGAALQVLRVQSW
jgi:hypothetical protein